MARHPSLLQGSMLKHKGRTAPGWWQGKQLLVCLIKKAYLASTKIGTGVHLMLIHKRATCYCFLLQNLLNHAGKTKRQEANEAGRKVNCNRGGGLPVLLFELQAKMYCEELQMLQGHSMAGLFFP